MHICRYVQKRPRKALRTNTNIRGVTDLRTYGLNIWAEGGTDSGDEGGEGALHEDRGGGEEAGGAARQLQQVGRRYVLRQLIVLLQDSIVQGLLEGSRPRR